MRRATNKLDAHHQASRPWGGRLLALCLGLSLGLVPVPVAGAEEAGAEEAGDEPAAKQIKPRSKDDNRSPRTLASREEPAKAGPVPVYRLPEVGKPRRRIGGGRRGPGQSLPSLYAIAPEHVGLTVSAQPLLCWAVSATPPEGVIFELVVTDANGIEPLLDVPIAPPRHVGIQCTDLGDYGLALAYDEDYQWAVAAVLDLGSRSLDLIATGWIERVRPPQGLEASLREASAGDAAAIYAEAGLWYDAVSAVWSAEGDPGEQLSALLGQVDLPPAIVQADVRYQERAVSRKWTP